jgi:hypothetical protein
MARDKEVTPALELKQLHTTYKHTSAIVLLNYKFFLCSFDLIIFFFVDVIR